MSRRYRVFISYGRQDRLLARIASEKLEERGAESFLDVKNIQFGDAFTDTILPEVERSDELLVFLTASSIERAWLFAEMGVALRAGKRVVGVVYGPSLDDLGEKGILTLVGDRKHLLTLDDLDAYADEVGRRAQAVLA